jgi:hypothetical protein
MAPNGDGAPISPSAERLAWARLEGSALEKVLVGLGSTDLLGK